MVMLLLLIIVLLAVGIYSVVWQFSRSNSRLEEWAAANGYKLIASKRRWFLRSPYWFTTSKSQEVFYVTLQDANGTTRHAYVRVGGFFPGQLSDHVDD